MTGVGRALALVDGRAPLDERALDLAVLGDVARGAGLEPRLEPRPPLARAAFHPREEGRALRAAVLLVGARREGQIAETVRAAEWPLGQAEQDDVENAVKAFRLAVGK